MSTVDLTFGDYIKSLRMGRKKSLRETASAIGVSAQYYSDVEKGRTCAFTVERLKTLEKFLAMTSEEIKELNNKASKTHKGKNIVVPQDFAGYIVENDYVMTALRKMKQMGADQEDWNKMVERFMKDKQGKDQ